MPATSTGADTSVPGFLTLSGTMDNIEPTQTPDLRLDISKTGQEFVSTSPTITMSNPTRYGQDRWEFTYFHNVTVAPLVRRRLHPTFTSACLLWVRDPLQ